MQTPLHRDSGNELVERYIGTAYDTVKTVSSNLDAINAVSDPALIDNINLLGPLKAEIEDIATKIDDLVDTDLLVSQLPYQLWLVDNPDGTEAQFLDSLIGLSAYEIWLALGNVGSEEDYINSYNAVVITAIEERIQALNGLSNGYLVFETLSLLQASGAPANGELGRVFADPINENNGDYGYVGTEWVKSRFDYLSILNREIADVLVNNSTRVQYGGNPLDSPDLAPTTYSQSGLGVGARIQENTYYFNKAVIHLRNSTPLGIIRFYLMDQNAPVAAAPSDSTLLYSVDVTDLPSTMSDYTINLPETIEVPAGSSMFILVAPAVPGTTFMKIFNTVSGEFRNNIRLTLGTPSGPSTFDELWYPGSADFIGVPPVLSLDSQLGADISNINSDLASISARTLALEGNTLSTPYFTIPNTVYGVVGTELNLYFDSIASCRSEGMSGLNQYSVSISGSVGKSERDVFTYTPNMVGTFPLVATMYGSSGLVVTTKSFNLVVNSVPILNAPKNILMIGDSLNSQGQVSSPVYANLSAITNTPTLVGSQGEGTVKYEAFGGRRFIDYISAGSPRFRLQVANVGSIVTGSIYAVGNNTYTILEVNVSQGIGNILVTGTATLPLNGDMALTSGSGDASITYTNVTQESSNGLFNNATGMVDIANYRSTISLPEVIDVVNIQLGVNDIFNRFELDQGTLTGIINNAKTLISAFLQDNSNCQVILQLPTLCGNTDDGFASNYGANFSRAIYELNMFRFRDLILDNFDSAQFNSNVIVGSAGLQIHRYYGYGLAAQPISTRIEQTRVKHINAVHPIQQGYNQISDATYSDIISVI